MARAIWKGVIRFGEEEVPVKLYSAVQDRGVHFRLLAGDTQRPVKQRLVNPVTDATVESDEVRKGFEAEEGVFVLLEEEDLAEVEPPASRDIEVLRFVPPEAIEPVWYDRPYWLGPDGSDGTYAALVEALKKEGREGVVRWTMRRKEYVGALLVEADRLMLITLRRAGEVVSAAELPAPEGRKLDAKELRMAEQLVAALEGAFDPAAFRDEYRERVRELVEAKAEGRTVKLEAPAERKETDSLAQALRASLQAAKKEKGRAA
jgi:DNA end-binding protein Ku